MKLFTIICILIVLILLIVGGGILVKKEVELVKTKVFFTQDNFIILKEFILENGDNETDKDMYGNNSNIHYKFNVSDVYLSSEKRQENINRNKVNSDFEEIVIKKVIEPSDLKYYYTNESEYYHIIFDKNNGGLAMNCPYSKCKENVGYFLFHEIIKEIENFSY